LNSKYCVSDSLDANINCWRISGEIDQKNLSFGFRLWREFNLNPTSPNAL
jgi:hypothetical protein